MSEKPEDFLEADFQDVPDAPPQFEISNQLEDLTEDDEPEPEPPGAIFSSTVNETDENERDDGFSRFTRSLPPDTSSAVVVVTRFPDYMGGVTGLRKPCKDKTPIYSFPWNEQTREDIIYRVQNDYGGGYYFFQMRVANQMTAYKWHDVVYDPAGLTMEEKSVVDLAEAKRINAGGEMRNAPVSPPSPPVIIAPPEKPKSRAELLREFADEYAALAEVYGPRDQPAPPPEPPRLSAKERLGEMFLESLSAQAEKGDTRAMSVLVEVGKEALGLNKKEPEAETATTFLGTIAHLLKHPNELDELLDVGEKAVGRFLPAIQANMPKPGQQNAAPVKKISRFARATAASGNVPDNGAARSPAPEPDTPAAPATETQPAASGAPKARVKMVRW